MLPTTDLKSPDILQNETTRERKENNLEDFFNTSDSVSKNSKGEKVSTLEKRRISPQWINMHFWLLFLGLHFFFIIHVILFVQVHKVCLFTRWDFKDVVILGSSRSESVNDSYASWMFASTSQFSLGESSCYLYVNSR